MLWKQNYVKKLEKLNIKNIQCHIKNNVKLEKQK